MNYGTGLAFEQQAFEDLAYWVATEPKKARKIIRLIKSALRDPKRGEGKPEPLKGDLSGCWSRRIDKTNRLVYKRDGSSLRVISCRYHYSNP